MLSCLLPSRSASVNGSSIFGSKQAMTGILRSFNTSRSVWLNQRRMSLLPCTAYSTSSPNITTAVQLESTICVRIGPSSSVRTVKSSSDIEARLNRRLVIQWCLASLLRNTSATCFNYSPPDRKIALKGQCRNTSAWTVYKWAFSSSSACCHVNRPYFVQSHRLHVTP